VRPSAAPPETIIRAVTRRRSLPLVATALAVLATPADASARTSRLHTAIPLPAPGHVTVAAVRMNATVDNPAQLPLRAKLRVKNAPKLPPSVKVLFATRSIATAHGRRYVAAIFIVRKAGAQAYSAAAPPLPANLDLLMWMGEREAEWTSQVVAIRNADKAKRRSRKTSTLGDLFRSDFTARGDPGLVFDNPSGTPDPTLDTGHYDDGHSFGWGTPPRPTLPPPDVIRVEIDLVEDLIERQPSQLMRDLEVATAVDLDGDGAIGPQQQIDTRVGPVVIT